MRYGAYRAVYRLIKQQALRSSMI